MSYTYGIKFCKGRDDMRKLWVILFVALFVCIGMGTALSEPGKIPERIEFQKSQSYEFVDILENFISYNNNANQSMVGNQNAKNARPEFLYWTDKSTLYPLNPVNIKPLYYYGGKIGLLFNGTAREKTEQHFEDGLLKNTVIPLGYTADYIFVSPLYWGFNSVQLQIDISPVFIKKLVDKDTKSFKLDLSSYFESRNYSASKIADTGNLTFGKSLWEITTPENKKAYIILRTSCGANGLIGSTDFIFYYKEKDATEFYNFLSPR